MPKYLKRYCKCGCGNEVVLDWAKGHSSRRAKRPRHRLARRSYRRWLNGYRKKNSRKLRRGALRYYRRNRRHVLQYQKRYVEQLRLEAFRRYGKGKARCVCCGQSNPLVLTLDHKNGDGNAHRRKINKGNKLFAGKAFYLWLKNKGWPKLPLQTMCCNCNFGRWRNGGICPLHGKN